MQANEPTMTPVPESLIGYVSDLELEVDRLRKQRDLTHQTACRVVERMQTHCLRLQDGSEAKPELSAMVQSVEDFALFLQDTQESVADALAPDHVAEIEVRPFVERIFKWQQRLLEVPHMQLNWDLHLDHITWFPIRLCHILENLVSNAIKFRHPGGEARLQLGLRASPASYELRLSDNGTGMSAEAKDAIEDLTNRAIPSRPLSVGVGLSVVKILVEQSGGTLVIDSIEGKGTSITVHLPRFDIGDFIS